MDTIDRKDREILFHLSLNARASLTELGKKTRLSKEVVHYRLKNMEKKGIIQGYYAVINPYRLGKSYYRVYLRTINMTAEVEKQFMDYLKDNQSIAWIAELDGNLDFLYIVLGETINEFEDVYNNINNRFGKYIYHKEFSVDTAIHFLKYKYLVGREDLTYKSTGGKIEKPEIDQTDRKLISLLSNEGRLPLVSIGKKLGISARVAQYRMKRLTKAGIISCFNVKVNHKALGYTNRKVMLNLNDTSGKVLGQLMGFVKNHPSSIYITIAIGQYDFEFEMMERSHEEFHSILKDLKGKFPALIKEYSTVIFYNEPKVGQLAFEKA
jgi:Lrp/AsnC family transcriptional regulator, leucine-responsive regulatory protein